MVWIRQTDRARHIAELQTKIDGALHELLKYYKFERHTAGFWQKPYFLLSYCAHLTFSVWSADEDNERAFFEGAARPAALATKLDLGSLRYDDYKRRMAQLQDLEDYLKNEPKWFTLWTNILEQVDPRRASHSQAFSRQVLAISGNQDFLEGTLSEKQRRAIEGLMQSDVTGRLLLRSAWVLEDLISAIARYLAKADPHKAAIEITTALACLLKQVRRTLVWETPARGVYAPRNAKRWRISGALAQAYRGGKEGLLTVVPRRDGSGIVCTYEWSKGQRRRSRSWTLKTSALKRPYEEELFQTWAYETGGYLDRPNHDADIPARWTLQSAEARRLNNLSHDAECLLRNLGRNPACRGLVEEVRSLLIKTDEAEQQRELPWTYIQQLDAALKRMEAACRQAHVPHRDDSDESIIARAWSCSVRGGTACQDTATEGLAAAGPSTSCVIASGLTDNQPE